MGAEAVKEGVLEIAEDEHWVKAEWYALIIPLAVLSYAELGSNYTFDPEWVLECS